MPLYEYECTKCKRHTEHIQKFSDQEITVCPHCKGLLERVISAPAIAFKGFGWFADGYGNAKPGTSGSEGLSDANGSSSSSAGTSSASSESSASSSSATSAETSSAPAATESSSTAAPVATAAASSSSEK
jgi:putative FmdB family regulatory protein